MKMLVTNFVGSRELNVHHFVIITPTGASTMGSPKGRRFVAEPDDLRASRDRFETAVKAEALYWEQLNEQGLGMFTIKNEPVGQDDETDSLDKQIAKQSSPVLPPVRSKRRESDREMGM